MERTLADLNGGRIPPGDAAMSFKAHKDGVEFGRWVEVEQRYGR